MTDTQIAANKYIFTLNIDLANYTAGGSYLNSLAFKVNNNSTFTNFSLLSTPDGTSNWNIVPGGLSSNGCNSSGARWMCITDTSNSGKGYSITPLSSHTSDKYVFEFDGVTLTSAGVELKANYVDSYGNKVGSLISAPITPVSAVPEPQTYAMMLAGLCLIGFILYRRKDDASNVFMAV
ncbi:PEP-CTERM motif protein [mine drainage metagenome]|uniref:PEP-CTERM motif protein n=1 Tax=mine drainage metagenome TaxID=410659 RepID=A0A1J5R7X5_9ZZZZ